MAAIKKKFYYFIDESGDPTFFDAKGNYIVGTEGCSAILILGFIKTEKPEEIRRALATLRTEISTDEYLKTIPSIKKSSVSFHAKNDCPEVREKVFKMLKTLPFKCQFIVARKRLDIFTKRHQKNENVFYNEIISRLLENKLHKSDCVLYFSKRGNQLKQIHLDTAIRSAILRFEEKTNTKVETETKVYIQVPTDEPCLQVIDYMNWAVYRAFTKREERYLTFLKEKVSFICDIYDLKKYPNNFYYKSNPFDVQKISPLELGDESRTA